MSTYTKRLKRRYWRMVRLFTTDPFKIADAWRKGPGMTIGANTAIYNNVQFGRGGKDPIIIGKNCTLTGCFILGHDASTNAALGIRFGQPSPQQETVIEDDCFIGVGAIVLMGVRVGAGSIVGAGAVVTKDVEPGTIVAGNPAKVVGTVAELVEKRKAWLGQK